MAQTLVTLAQHPLQVRPVELQEVEQPAIQVWIAAGSTQRRALQQPQCVRSRQPVVLTHPAVDGEQAKGKSPVVQADGDQMGQWSLRPGAPEQMQMAVFADAPMAVVVALRAAARGHQIVSGVVLVLQRRASAGEGPHQGTVALGQAQPVVERLTSRSIAAASLHLSARGAAAPFMGSAARGG